MPRRLLQHVARLRSRQILLMGKPRMRNARRPSSAHLAPQAAPVSTAVRKVFDGLGTWVADSLSAGLKVNCHVETRVNNVLSARVCVLYQYIQHRRISKWNRLGRETCF